MFAAAQFARSRGVAGLGQAAAWLNGLLVSPDAGITWQQQLQFNLQLEQQRLQVRPGSTCTLRDAHALHSWPSCGVQSSQRLSTTLLGSQMHDLYLKDGSNLGVMFRTTWVAWCHLSKHHASTSVSLRCAQEMVYYQTIDDDDEDILAAILSASDAAPKYNPDLLKGASDQQARRSLLSSHSCLSFPLLKALDYVAASGPD